MKNNKSFSETENYAISNNQYSIISYPHGTGHSGKRTTLPGEHKGSTLGGTTCGEDLLCRSMPKGISIRQCGFKIIIIIIIIFVFFQVSLKGSNGEENQGT